MTTTDIKGLEELASLLTDELTDRTGREWGIGYNAGRPSIYEWNDDGTTNLSGADTWAELIAVMRAHLAHLGPASREAGIQGRSLTRPT
jgi:hypothetical protein